MGAAWRWRRCVHGNAACAPRGAAVLVGWAAEYVDCTVCVRFVMLRTRIFALVVDPVSWAAEYDECGKGGVSKKFSSYFLAEIIASWSLDCVARGVEQRLGGCCATDWDDAVYAHHCVAGLWLGDRRV